jgi:hypothetical protein
MQHLKLFPGQQSKPLLCQPPLRENVDLIIGDKGTTTVELDECKFPLHGMLPGTGNPAAAGSVSAQVLRPMWQ